MIEPGAGSGPRSSPGRHGTGSSIKDLGGARSTRPTTDYFCLDNKRFFLELTVIGSATAISHSSALLLRLYLGRLAGLPPIRTRRVALAGTDVADASQNRVRPVARPAAGNGTGPSTLPS